MNEMIDSRLDDKNEGLWRVLWRLRQTLDVHCLLTVYAADINKKGVGKGLFFFWQKSCEQLMVLYTCRAFEEEKSIQRGAVQYELDSIGSILRYIGDGKASALDPDGVRAFVKKHGTSADGCGLAALRAAVAEFRKQHAEALSRFKTLRNKWVVHSESEFTAMGAPLSDDMERLLGFGLDFYRLVSQALGVGPMDLNRDRRVRTSLTRVLQKLGYEDIKTDWSNRQPRETGVKGTDT